MILETLVTNEERFGSNLVIVNMDLRKRGFTLPQFLVLALEMVHTEPW